MTPNGVPSRYIDETTRNLNRLAATLEDVQNSRLRAENRGDLFSAEHLKAAEDTISRALKKSLKAHIIYDWLPRGLAGARTARVLAAIGDPRRFPGQQCTGGHTFPPLYEVGTACPAETPEMMSENEGIPGGSPGSADNHNEIETIAGRCPGAMLDPRSYTGVSSLWRYFGLIPGEDGSLIRRRKGVQASYSPRFRALILGDMGIADQIIRHRTEPYRTTYDEFKSRRQAEMKFEPATSTGLPPWRLDKIARIVAAKAFVGDLLMEWKRRVS